MQLRARYHGAIESVLRTCYEYIIHCTMDSKPRILGIIPARGGSKRLPGKNIRPLAGKPLIVWTIEQAQKCSLIDTLIVNTDSEEIASIARRFGAEVPFLRPAK